MSYSDNFFTGNPSNDKTKLDSAIKNPNISSDEKAQLVHTYNVYYGDISRPVEYNPSTDICLDKYVLSTATIPEEKSAPSIYEQPVHMLLHGEAIEVRRKLASDYKDILARGKKAHRLFHKKADKLSDEDEKLYQKIKGQYDALTKRIRMWENIEASVKANEDTSVIGQDGCM